ncbi:unnamed protein product [Allacma fusca]|uniref:Uncharacterized protein n=1 Tax=Allacma fusca TaxID=39272 RepID=A0A8J2KG17_9HEXA|nr:unnamed protein product [Allacma fusca]
MNYQIRYVHVLINCEGLSVAFVHSLNDNCVVRSLDPDRVASKLRRRMLFPIPAAAITTRRIIARIKSVALLLKLNRASIQRLPCFGKSKRGPTHLRLVAERPIWTSSWNSGKTIYITDDHFYVIVPRMFLVPHTAVSTKLANMSDVIFKGAEIRDSIALTSISPQLQVNQSRSCEPPCVISHRRFLIIGAILTSGLVTTLITIKFFSKSDLVDVRNPGKVETKFEGQISLSHSHDNQLTVNSATDLKDLTFEQDTVVVEELDEEYIESYSLIISEHTNIKNLTIFGPISHFPQVAVVSCSKIPAGLLLNNSHGCCLHYNR